MLKMNSEVVDLIVIGGGSGNRTISDVYKGGGKTAVIVEPRRFGGTCLNFGCIPSKMLARTAYVASSPEEGFRLNVQMKVENVDWAAVRNRVFAHTDSSSARSRLQLEQHVRWISEEVVLDGPRAIITQRGQRIEGHQIVIAAGSRPRVPNIPGVHEEGVYTSDDIMRIKDFPKRLVVIGGGPVGCEFSTIFSGLGSKVTQLVRGGELMSAMDPEVSTRFTQLASQNWNVHPHQDVESIEKTGSGLLVVTQEMRIQADAVLLATGRIPNSDRLKAAAAGYDLDEQGRLLVDEQLRAQSGGRPVPGAYALGDVIPGPQLKHVANYEAEIVRWNLLHPRDLKTRDDRPVASATFSIPELAAVGLTEAAAKDKLGADRIVTYTKEYAGTAFGWAMGDAPGLVKVIGDKTSGKLVGGQILGEDASNLLQTLTMAITFGIRPGNAASGEYWVHPALSEVVRDALFGLAEKIDSSESAG